MPLVPHVRLSEIMHEGPACWAGKTTMAIGQACEVLLLF